MATPEHHAGPGTYFVTTATYNRRSRFQVDAHAELFLETLQQYRGQGKFKLHAFVIMRDHVHLLLTPCEITIERAMALIKGGYSHRLHSTRPVWQRGFTARRIRDREEFLARLNYIHSNPVRAHMAERPEQYRYSSAYRQPAQKESISG
jgi:putative transposase